tara:strand:- start:534 stop:725 length:192 start_codon:yes stop_codon:yes gene_type:complete
MTLSTLVCIKNKQSNDYVANKNNKYTIYQQFKLKIKTLAKKKSEISYNKNAAKKRRFLILKAD